MNHGLTAAAAAQLRDGIFLSISRWAALQIAFDRGHGGRNPVQKSQQLGHDLFNLLTQSKEQVYIEDVEEMLEEFMSSLNGDADDGSIEEIALILMVMHEECSEGNFDSIKRMKETKAPRVCYVKQCGNNDDTLRENTTSVMEVDATQVPEVVDDTLRENNTSAMEVDPPQATQVPEDGDEWTPVVPSRRRNKETQTIISKG